MNTDSGVERLGEPTKEKMQHIPDARTTCMESKNGAALSESFMVSKDS